MGLIELLEEKHDKSLRDIIIDLYVIKDMSMRETSRELGVSAQTIKNWCLKYGITKNKRR